MFLSVFPQKLSIRQIQAGHHLVPEINEQIFAEGLHARRSRCERSFVFGAPLRLPSAEVDSGKLKSVGIRNQERNGHGYLRTHREHHFGRKDFLLHPPGYQHNVPVFIKRHSRHQFIHLRLIPQSPSSR